MGQDVQRRSVLVADDNREVVKAAEQLLEGLHCSLEMASDGVDVLVRLEWARPSVLLLDRYCRDLDAIDLCALLRAQAEYATLPVVMLHDGLGRLELMKATAVGMSAVLAKPFSGDEFRATLSPWLPPVLEEAASPLPAPLAGISREEAP